MTDDYCMTCYDPTDDDTGEFEIDPFVITDDDGEED